MKKTTLLCLLILLSSGLFFSPPSARAVEEGLSGIDPKIQQALLNMTKQIEELRVIIQEQGMKIQALEGRPSVPIPGAQAQPIGEKEFKSMLEKEMPQASYLKNIKLGGDFRLRWDSYAEEESAGSLEDRNRFRYRLRYGLESNVGDDMTVGFRLVSALLNARDTDTSNASRTVFGADPTSTNQTMGAPGLFSQNTIGIDKAFAKYEPSYLKNIDLGPALLKKFEVAGGKFENPHLKYSSQMVWDSDVTPEGLYEKFDLNLFKGKSNEVNLFGIAMQSPLKESASGESDASLMSFQGGLTGALKTSMMEKPVEFTSAFASYFYNNYAERSNYMLEGATSLARGNTTCVGTAGAGPCTGLEAGDPKVLDFYNEIKLTPVGNVPVSIFNDVATNVNNGAVSGASAQESTAWGLGAKLGGVKKRGDWEIGYSYYQIPPNAVVGAFSDSDFGHGFTNNEGGILKADYGLTDSLTVNFTWFHVSPYTTGIATDPEQQTDKFQTNLSWKF